MRGPLFGAYAGTLGIGTLWVLMSLTSSLPPHKASVIPLLGMAFLIVASVAGGLAGALVGRWSKQRNRKPLA